MGIGSSFNRWLDYMDREYDEDAFQEVFVNEYYCLLWFTCIYPKMRGKWRVISVIQYVVFFVLLIIHMMLLAKASCLLIDINFVLFNESAHFFVLLFLACSVLMCGFYGRKELGCFHNYVYKNFYDYGEPEDESPEIYHREMLRERKILLLVPFVVGACVPAIIVIAPILDEYGTFDLAGLKEKEVYIDLDVPVPMYYPFKRDGKIVVYVMTLFQLMCGSAAASLIAGGGLGYCFMCQHVIKQYKIVIQKTETLHERAINLHRRRFGTKPTAKGDSVYSDINFLQCYDTCFKKIYEHHIRIIQSTKEMSGVLCVPLFIVYSGGSIIIAFAMITGEQLPGTAVAALLACFLEVMFMYLFSSFGQRMTNLGEDFRESLFRIKWPLLRKKTTSSLAILQTCTSTPFVLSLFGMLPANLDTFSAIMNSAYSFYNLVVAMN